MTTAEKFNEVDFIIDFETGQLNNAEIVAGFQHLLDSGIVWRLQGHYGRTAKALLDAGLIVQK